MAEISIGRLSLHLSGISESDGCRLIRMVADGLALASLPNGAEDRDAMQLRITLRSGSSLQQISDQVVTDLLSQLDRSL